MTSSLRFLVKNVIFDKKDPKNGFVRNFAEIQVPQKILHFFALFLANFEAQNFKKKKYFCSS